MPNKFHFADFWLRFIAGTIDLVIVIVATTILSLILPILGDLFKVLLPLSYFIYLESSPKQATIGKQFLNIKVVDLKGNRISPSTALIRNISKIISFLLFGFGFIMVAFTEKNRGLHDIIAETLVVQNTASDEIANEQDKQKEPEFDSIELTDQNSSPLKGIKSAYPEPIAAEAE